jgi:hypothetical protein
MLENYKKEKLFDFNLLPEITEEEIKVLVERDNSLVYSFILVFGATFIFFILTLLEFIVIDGRTRVINTKIKDLQIQSVGFNQVKLANGEYVRKANLLENALDKDIKISEFLNIANSIVGESGTILSYERLPTGLFSITIITPTYESLVGIVSNAKTISNIDKIFISRITNEKGIADFRFSLRFEIKNT